MRKFTIILLYPDYIRVAEAVTKAQKQCAEDNGGIDGEWEFDVSQP